MGEVRAVTWNLAAVNNNPFEYGNYSMLSFAHGRTRDTFMDDRLADTGSRPTPRLRGTTS